METPKEVLDSETIAEVSPPTVVVWADIKRKTLNEIFVEATGIQPEDEEEEYICRAESTARMDAQMYELLRTEAAVCAVRATQTEVLERDLDRDSDYADEDLELFEHAWFEKMGQLEEEDTRYFDNEERHQVEVSAKGEVMKTEVFISQAKGEDARQPQNHKKDFQAKGEDSRQPSFTKRLPYTPDRGKWAGVKGTMLTTTSARLRELSQDGDDRLSAALESYIESLTNPDVSVVVCQGRAGCGKAYTATLAACLAVQAGPLQNVKQTKPLVVTGGVGLGYERGEMADKLKYWCAPAREAMERMRRSEENVKKKKHSPLTERG